MHLTSAGWVVGLTTEAGLVFAAVADPNMSAFGKFAVITGLCLALAAGIGALSPAIAKARREQAIATEGTDRDALARLRREHEDQTRDLQEARDEVNHLREELKSARVELGHLRDVLHQMASDVANAQKEAARVTALMVGWAHWRLVEAPEVDDATHGRSSGPNQTLIPRPFPEPAAGSHEDTEEVL